MARVALPPILLALFAGALEAQAGPRPIFVTIPDAFPDVDAHAIVLREPDREIVLLRGEDATAEALWSALSVLDRARERTPRPGVGEMIPITGFAVTALSRRTQARLERALARLEQRPVTQVGSLGSGRWMRLGGGGR